LTFLMAHKLLLADDSVTIQRVIELTFADEDVEVITVGDGQLAIDRLDTDPPDIVLADVDMPKRDGYEVAAYVKSRPKLAHIPVVLLTGAFEPIDQVRATAAGSSDVLAKPFEPQMVINRVKELLGKKRPNEDEQYDALPRQTPTAPPAPQTVSHIAKPAPANGPATGDGGLSLDDYFDQLDAAFSNLQQPGAQAAEAVHEEIDWAAAMAPAAAVYAPVETTGASAFAPGASTYAPSAPADKPADKPAHNSVAVAAPAAPVAVAPIAPVAPIEPIAPIEPVAPVAPSVPEPVAFTAPAATAPVAARAPDAPIAHLAPAVAAFVPSDVTAASTIAPGATADKSAPKPVAPEMQAASEVAPKPVTQRITTNPFATLSAAKAEAAARAAAPVITDEVIEEVVARVLQRLSDKVVRETVTEIVSATAERLVQEEIERIKDAGS
jgi:CheY-like chemotaxis protein